MPSLPRIFPRDAETFQRSGANPDLVETQGEGLGPTMIDAWRPVIRISSESKEGLSRGLQWLCLLAHSGVEVPVTVFTRFSTLVTEHKSSLPDSLLLVKAIMFSTWLKSVGRQELQIVFSQLHTRLAPIIKAQFANGNEVIERWVYYESYVHLSDQSLANLLFKRRWGRVCYCMGVTEEKLWNSG